MLTLTPETKIQATIDRYAELDRVTRGSSLMTVDCVIRTLNAMEEQASIRNVLKARGVKIMRTVEGTYHLAPI